MKRGMGFWVLQGIAIMLLIMLLSGQTLSLFDYELAVSLGLQESVEEVTKVGVSFAKGFAFGDTVFYIPILFLGVLGLFKNKTWGLYSMLGALAITVYWPAVHLFAVFVGKEHLNLSVEKYQSYYILLPLISIYGLWGMWYLYVNQVPSNSG